MSDLFDKSIRTLELPRVLELLSEQAVSAEAKQRALRLRPETEPEEVLRLLDQTDAARNLIGLRGSPSFSGVKPVAEALDRAEEDTLTGLFLREMEGRCQAEPENEAVQLAVRFGLAALEHGEDGAL